MEVINNGRKYTREEIGVISQSALGKTLREIKGKTIFTGFSDNEGKGSYGQLIENYLFGMKNNSDSEPDFIDAGIELKVTPYKKLKNGKLSAKERLVLNIIDYNTEYQNEFRTSHFWFKNNKIQLLWYLWEESKDKLDYKITHEKLLELSESEDLKQIEKDWYTIINKIKDGKAEEISEADTMYLGACTKGANSSSKRTQPFSNVLAMQRAFCFKTSYMTQLVRKYIENNYSGEKVLKTHEETFDMFVEKVINKYRGKTKSDLMKEFNIDSESKGIFNILINRMFNVKSNLKDTEEFKKANIVPKTIRVEENGRIIESMSFPYFKFKDIANTDFEYSDLKEQLETTKFMFFIFKRENKEYVFKGIMLWNMPETIIQSKVRDVYEKTQNVIKNGNIVKCIDARGRRITNFPGMSNNGVCHVRPHGRDAKDTCELPATDKLTGAKEFTKQCFWFNNNYIKNIIKDYLK